MWAHKYNLIGLITYMRYTGNLEPLPACRRMADLLCKTFGDEPGKRDIIKAGEHKGMAPTSVLEPMVLLYRLTGEPRYLEFCKYILRAWEQPNGPKIISTLLTAKRVDKVGNGKAYEMLSCLNGALEYYRTTGEPRILEACLNAWQDIVRNRLYITGAASYGEFFHDDFDLPNVGQCRRDLRHGHLAAVQCAVAAADRRSAFRRAARTRRPQPVVRRAALRRLGAGATTCRWKARSLTAARWTAIAASPAARAASRSSPPSPSPPMPTAWW